MTSRDLYSHHATVLPVADLARARDWYRDVLGFSVEFEWEDPPTYAVLRAGESVQIHLGLVDALHARVAAWGATVTFPPETMAYGMREFEVRDPDGHKLVFGQGAGADEAGA